MRLGVRRRAARWRRLYRSLQRLSLLVDEWYLTAIQSISYFHLLRMMFPTNMSLIHTDRQTTLSWPLHLQLKRGCATNATPFPSCSSRSPFRHHSFPRPPCFPALLVRLYLAHTRHSFHPSPHLRQDNHPRVLHCPHSHLSLAPPPLPNMKPSCLSRRRARDAAPKCLSRPHRAATRSATPPATLSVTRCSPSPASAAVAACPHHPPACPLCPHPPASPPTTPPARSALIPPRVPSGCPSRDTT